MHSSLASLIGPHDLPLVAVAAAMCFFASYVTVRVNRRLRGMNVAAERRRWFLGAVVTGGTSIWTTHFVAVLAYQPALSLSFEPVRTGLSLVLAMGTAAAVWSVCNRSIARLLLGGLAMGLGTAGMHYLGMSAVHFHGDFAWNLHLIGLSAVPGILFGTAALAVFARWSAPSADVVSAGLLTLAICLLHFTGMAAATIHHDAAVQHLFALVDRSELAIGVIASAGIVLSIGFVSAMAAQRFEQAQREMARMRTIAEAVVEGIAICDGDVFREVNASFAILVGCDASSLVGRPVSDVLLVRTGAGPIAGEAAQATLADLLARSGERIPVEIVERTIVQPDGHRRLLSVRDLRGRLKLRRLRGIERAAIRMASATSDAVICADSTGRITIWNRAAEAMFGHSRSQAVGQSFDIIFPERHRAAHRAVFERLSRSEAAKLAGQVLEMMAVHHGGHEFPIEMSLAAWREGGTYASGASIRDISARNAAKAEMRRQQAALSEAKEKAEAAAQAKSDFLANMSHELRTPLNGILGYTDILLTDHELGAVEKRHVQRIQTAGTALLAVVNDVLCYSNIETGQVVLRLQPFSVRAFVEDTVSIIHPLSDQKSLILSASLDPALPATLIGDTDRLRQVLLNLLNNAVKFTPSGSVRLHVAAQSIIEDSYRVTFEVADTGIGIPADKRDRLFQTFSQVDGSVQREFGGTGLGLAISKGLVGLMGGEIGFDSAVGRGSTFAFTIPLRAAAETLSVQSGTVKHDDASGLGRILVADDNESNQEIAQAILEGAGYRVLVVGNGASAVKAVRNERLDLVLMDIQMPIMDGITATRCIREFDGPERTVPIVAMTANVLPHQVTAFREAGMDDHIGKPFRRDALLEVVRRHVQALARVA